MRCVLLASGSGTLTQSILDAFTSDSAENTAGAGTSVGAADATGAAGGGHPSGPQALTDPGSGHASGVEIAAVGSDTPDAGALARASGAGVHTFVVAPRDFPDRQAWNRELTRTVASYTPDWVVSAGFMRILGPEFIARFAQRIINTHPALLPAFPGAHGVRDALAYGVKVTGTTIHLVDEGVDTGPIIAQFPVPVSEDDTVDSLHERIRAIERARLVELLGFLAEQPLVVSGRRVSGYSPDLAPGLNQQENRRRISGSRTAHPSGARQRL